MHFFARHRENIRQSAMSARLLWPCLLLVVLLVLTLRKTGCKLPQAAAILNSGGNSVPDDGAPGKGC